MLTKIMKRHRDGLVIASPCWIANSFSTRLIGLMGRESMPQGAGLLLNPSNSIHTFFMRFPIDVVYMDRNGNDFKVIKIRSSMKPWRMDLPVLSANSILELHQGNAKVLTEGDLLCLS